MRIKKTGEIVKISDYATINLDSCDSWGNPIELKPEDVELIQEQTEDEHWQDVRERAAIAVMQGLLSNSKRNGFTKDYVEAAIDYADVLVKRLKKK